MSSTTKFTLLAISALGLLAFYVNAQSIQCYQWSGIGEPRQVDCNSIVNCVKKNYSNGTVSKDCGMDLFSRDQPASGVLERANGELDYYCTGNLCNSAPFTVGSSFMTIEMLLLGVWAIGQGH